VLLNGASAPVSGLTGGIIPPFCPPVPSASELAAIEAMPAGERGPAEVAAMIKADEAAAKARVAAIEYLGTVDCRYWPEATEQLVNALRADRNECVRFAAARVLSTGCCCNKETIDKLKISITGSEEDGKPAELSQRVRMAAQIALHNCLARYSEPFEAPPPPERETEEPTPTDSPDEKREEATPAIPLSVGTTDGHPGGDGLVQTAYERQIARKPAAQVVAEARQALLMASQQRASAMTTGRRSVYHAFSKAVTAPGDRGTPGAMAPRLPLSHTTAAQTAGGGDRSHDPAVVNTSTAARSSGAAAASGNRGLLGIFSDSRRRGSR
jgi:hypothetical protein